MGGAEGGRTVCLCGSSNSDTCGGHAGLRLNLPGPSPRCCGGCCSGWLPGLSKKLEDPGQRGGPGAGGGGPGSLPGEDWLHPFCEPPSLPACRGSAFFSVLGDRTMGLDLMGQEGGGGSPAQPRPHPDSARRHFPRRGAQSKAFASRSGEEKALHLCHSVF